MKLKNGEHITTWEELGFYLFLAYFIYAIIASICFTIQLISPPEKEERVSYDIKWTGWATSTPPQE